MTDWMMQSTEHDLSEMLGAFLRRQTSNAKELARLIDCDPRTAEGFRAGRYWPSARHWRLIVRTFGRDVWSAVFEPEIDDMLARLRREQRELEERLEAIKTRRRQALGGLAEPEERSFARHDRAEAIAEGPPNGDLFEDLRP